MNSEKKVIGEGTYGCVIKAPLECNKQQSPSFYEDKVSKVMKTKAAKEELKEMKKIAKTKGINKYALNVPTLCEPSIDEEFIEGGRQEN